MHNKQLLISKVLGILGGAFGFTIGAAIIYGEYHLRQGDISLMVWDNIDWGVIWVIFSVIGFLASFLSRPQLKAILLLVCGLITYGFSIFGIGVVYDSPTRFLFLLISLIIPPTPLFLLAAFLTFRARPANYN